jgi:hypothetical protein
MIIRIKQNENFLRKTIQEKDSKNMFIFIFPLRQISRISLKTSNGYLEPNVSIWTRLNPLNVGQLTGREQLLLGGQAAPG